MGQKFLKTTLAISFAICAVSCGAKNSDEKSGEKIKIYGVKSGYFKTQMPVSQSVAQTWFDDYGNLQFVEMTTENDTVKSFKLVRNGEEYFYSTFDKNGMKRTVEYVDYRTWENPSEEVMKAQGMQKLPTLMMFGKACKTFFVNGYVPNYISIWNGLVMKNMDTDGNIFSEVVELRECAVPMNMFDVPEDVEFKVEVPQDSLVGGNQ